MTVLVRLAGAVLTIAMLGCGGASPPPGPFQDAALTLADPQLPGAYYYDVWTFVPTDTKRDLFRMESDNIDSYMILKNSSGQTIQTGSAAGYNQDDGSFDGNASVSALLFAGQTYTLTTSSQNPGETGRYRVHWQDGVQLISGGT